METFMTSRLRVQVSVQSVRYELADHRSRISLNISGVSEPYDSGKP